MKRIVVFGNCQAKALSRFIAMGLPQNDWRIEYLFNNEVTGQMASRNKILHDISHADVVIYQPLGTQWGELSESHIRQIANKSCTLISFVYIFNSGVYSLCHAPSLKKDNKKYGTIFGEDIVTDLLSKESLDEILLRYRQGEIDFNLLNRFEVCLDEMRRREQTTDIKISDYIENNYKEQKLFLTHNHPSSALLCEICRHISGLSDIPIHLEGLDLTNENIANLPQTNCPISPHDVYTHGYAFGHHSDWFTKGTELIRSIANSYVSEKGS